MDYIVKIDELYNCIVDSMTIHKEINTHGYVDIRAHAFSEHIEEIKSVLESERPLHVTAYNTSKHLFCGIILESEISEDIDQYYIHVVMTSETRLLDEIERKRYFIQQGVTYKQIFDYVKGDFSYNNLSEATGEVGKIVMQFLETDWEFMKRVAAKRKSFLVPDFEEGGKRFFIGMPSERIITIETKFYHKIIPFELYERKVKNGINTSPAGETIYQFESEENYPIGTNIIHPVFSGYVFQVDTTYQEGIISSVYLVKNKVAMSTIPYPNIKIIGASMDAKASVVGSDNVQPEIIGFDGLQSPSKSMSFATVYSSTGDAGWYCMPEEGDAIRVCFPDEDEDNAFIVNAKQVDKAGKKPEIKFFRSPSGKEIEFGTSYLKISNGDGLTITLDDNKGINIESTGERDICLSADQNVKITSSMQSIKMVAGSEISMTRDKSSVIINDDVTLTGKQVHVKEL